MAPREFETETIMKGNTSPMARLRRSASAPSSSTKLVEEHYRVEGDTTASRVVLPGVPKHEADWARDAHDFFNLVVLVPLIVLNVMNWNWDMLFNMPANKTYEDAWHGEWFFPFYIFAQSYFVADLAWIIFIPTCVRSPTTIIQHHVATILYMLVPYFFEDFRFIMGALLSVEINTWFLIARRVFNKQGLPPWIIGLPPVISIRIKLISICFYATWIVIRCIIYPVLIIEFVKRYNARTILLGTRFNIWAVVLPLHLCFVTLNLKWSYDLLMSKMRYWRRSRGRGEKNKKEDLSNGL